MRTYRTSYVMAAFAAALSLVLARPCAADVPATVLALPDGYGTGCAVAVNASGQIAGYVGYAHACVWPSVNGTPVVLQDLPGCDGGEATAINGSGVVVGWCHLPTGYNRAARWVPQTDGTYTVEDLGVLDEAPYSAAFAINDQGQILCESGAYGGHWFLWEAGVGQTRVTMPDGTWIGAGAPSGGLLGPDGRVAGTADVGYGARAMLWQKSGTTVQVTALTVADPSGWCPDATAAISPGGVLAVYSGYDSAWWALDLNTGDATPMHRYPGPFGQRVPAGIASVNDHGQAVVPISVFGSTGIAARELWLWWGGAWTEVPLDSLTPADQSFNGAGGCINRGGQVAGAARFSGNQPGCYTARAFAWSAGTGTLLLDYPQGTDQAYAAALNDSGLAVGGAYASDYSVGLPVAWQLSPANQPPTLDCPESLTVDEATTCTFTATASDLDGGDTPILAVSGLPDGARFDRTTGVFTWTPSEAQGPGTYTVTVTATDWGFQTVSRDVTITVNEVNTAPTLDVSSAPTTGIVGAPVTFTATATDPDIPAGALTFSLGSNAPAGATIDPATGAFSWTPTVGGTFTFDVTVKDADGLSDTRSVTVRETYSWSDFLQPIDAPNANRVSSSVFKAGSTVTVRFALTGASAGIANAVARLYCSPYSGAILGADQETVCTAPGDSGNQFRYSGGQYIYNWSTKGLTRGSYQLNVDLGDGVPRYVIISLK